MLSENGNEPAVRPFAMEELEQLDRVYEDECELSFESVNDLFPASERNGPEIRSNSDWDFNDQTSDVIASDTATQQIQKKECMSFKLRCFSTPPSCKN